MIEIEGQPSSAEIGATLAAENRPVLLAFSGGKDAICAYYHLRAHDIDVIPYHMEAIPGLRFVTETLAEWEEIMQRHIIRIPHPSFWRLIRNATYQPPVRAAKLMQSDLPNYDYADVIAVLRSDHATPDTWVADGVRACDSIVRRTSIITNGAMKRTSGKVSVIWDWQISDIRACLKANDVKLPVDYDWFGRSFDGIDRRFLAPIAEHAPDDYARILHYFPLAEMELLRHG